MYFVFCNMLKINYGDFFKLKEIFLKFEIFNYYISILILYDFVGCFMGYFG